MALPCAGPLAVPAPAAASGRVPSTPAAAVAAAVAARHRSSRGVSRSWRAPRLLDAKARRGRRAAASTASRGPVAGAGGEAAASLSHHYIAVLLRIIVAYSWIIAVF